jgi:glycosyltransferase involved in cell wall biosynthesis
MLSVLIPTLNEARNIADCVSSVRWADEVILVDSGSTDGTQDLGRKAGASVVDFNWNRRFPKKKNWALDNVALNHEWVLIVDADERITLELASEIQAELRAPRADGYFINRRFMFMGKWIRHCGYSPSWNLRLFRHKLGRYEKLHAGDTGSGDNEVHEHVVLRGQAGHMRYEMLHYAYPDIYTWMEKHNRYSNWEAQVEISDKEAGRAGQGVGRQFAKRRALREWSRRMPFRPTLRFVYSYILRRGFLDGREGFIFCRLLATYEMLSVYKAHELRQRKSSERVR